MWFSRRVPAWLPYLAQQRKKVLWHMGNSEPMVRILGTGLSVRLAGYARCQETGTEASQENDVKVSVCHKSP